MHLRVFALEINSQPGASGICPVLDFPSEQSTGYGFPAEVHLWNLGGLAMSRASRSCRYRTNEGQPQARSCRSLGHQLLRPGVTFHDHGWDRGRGTSESSPFSLRSNKNSCMSRRIYIESASYVGSGAPPAGRVGWAEPDQPGGELSTVSTCQETSTCPSRTQFLRRRNNPRLLASWRLGEYVNQARCAIVLSRRDGVAGAIRTLEIEGM